MTVYRLINLLLKLCKEGHVNHNTKVFVQIEKDSDEPNIDRVLTVARAKSLEAKKNEIWIKGSILKK